MIKHFHDNLKDLNLEDLDFSTVTYDYTSVFYIEMLVLLL